jgi:hypothetical protein
VAWVLGYKEVYGNEVVDKLAKEGLELLILYTRTAIITYIKRWAKSERKWLWELD